jgi:DNA-binding PadR family transcriptional regulator
MNKNNQNLGGSIKRKIVNPDLQEERDSSQLNRYELEEFFITKDGQESMEKWYKDIDKHPELVTGFEWYDMTREEKFETWYKRFNMVAAIDRDKYLDKLTFKRN